jgi:hypothetical protein
MRLRDHTGRVSHRAQEPRSRAGNMKERSHEAIGFLSWVRPLWVAENPSQAIDRSPTPRGTYCFALDQRNGRQDPSPMRVNRNSTRLSCRDAVVTRKS